jgi:hypothetical protein
LSQVIANLRLGFVISTGLFNKLKIREQTSYLK